MTGSPTFPIKGNTRDQNQIQLLHRNIFLWHQPQGSFRLENAISAFFQFIHRLVATNHPDTEQVLLMILGRAEHDRMTYQEELVPCRHLKVGRHGWWGNIAGAHGLQQ